MVDRITHDWYQTETQVVIEIRIKKLAADMVKVDIGDTSLSVTAIWTVQGAGECACVLVYSQVCSNIVFFSLETSPASGGRPEVTS